MKDIGIQHVLAQMREIKALQQDVFSSGEAIQETGTQKTDFSALLKQQVDKVNEVMASSKELADRLVQGDTSISEVEVMVSLQKASVAYQALNQVRNKLLTAYQEVMSMTV